MENNIQNTVTDIDETLRTIIDDKMKPEISERNYIMLELMKEVIRAGIFKDKGNPEYCIKECVVSLMKKFDLKS